MSESDGKKRKRMPLKVWTLGIKDYVGQRSEVRFHAYEHSRGFRAVASFWEEKFPHDYRKMHVLYADGRWELWVWDRVITTKVRADSLEQLSLGFRGSRSSDQSGFGREWSTIGAGIWKELFRVAKIWDQSFASK